MAMLLLVASNALGNPPAVPPSRGADARWQNLAQRLGNSDGPTRDNAMKELEKVTWHDLEILRTLAASASNPDVKARLAKRIAEIEEDLAVNPPGLTLDFKEASLADVTRELSNAMGIEFDANNPFGSRPGPMDVFSLTARERPFWEVFFALSRQHSLWYDDGGTVHLGIGGGFWHFGAFSGPVAIFPQTIIRQRNAILQEEPGFQLEREQVTLSCGFRIDPRLHVLKYSPVVFTAIVNDQGNNLLPPQPEKVPMADVNGRLFQGPNAEVHLLIAAKMGTRIASAKGYVRLLLQIAEDRVEIPEAEEKVGKSFKITGKDVTISGFSVQDRKIQMDFSVAPSAIAQLGSEEADEPRIRVQLEDAAGRVMINSPIRSTMETAMDTRIFTQPFKLLLSATTKTKEVSYPFELKDLPLP
jgi:hypothetical protein